MSTWSNPGTYTTWERFWLHGGDPDSDERRLNGDLKATVVRARAFQQAMLQPMTTRCGICEWQSTGTAGETLAAYKRHKCVPRQAARTRKARA